jgi:glycosyltransferase involved in cell wall biosynthesis
MTTAGKTHRPSISVILIVFNEEDNLTACLESVRWADEIIVVDGFSTDKTAELANRFGAKVFQKTFSGYGEQKQYALTRASCDWVLSIDADERVTPGLCDEIREILSASPSADGFMIPFQNIFFGKWLKRAGLYPDLHVRLFRRSSGSFTSSAIHEGIEIKGEIGHLQNPATHYSYPNIASYIRKMNRYSTLLASNGKSFRLRHMMFSPVSKFLRLYIGRRGFLDGMAGLVYCLLAAFYNFVKDAKVWEKNRSC